MHVVMYVQACEDNVWFRFNQVVSSFNQVFTIQVVLELGRYE